MKILYVILDGLGDRAIKEFEGKTPLEAAQTPNLDWLAKEGKTGLSLPVGEGIAPESDVGVISILGYEAEKYYTGRGPLECFAEGLEVRDGDLAYRVNFASIGENGEIIDRRVGRDLTTQEAKELGEEINQRVKLTSFKADFWFKPSIGHRGVLLIRCYEGPLSQHISNTDPAYGKQGVFGIAREKYENKLQISQPEPGYENDPKALRSAKLTNEFIARAREVLQAAEVNRRRVSSGKLPGNGILTRDAGDSLPKFPNLVEKYSLKFGSLVEMPVEKGIALLTGMEIVEVPPASKNYKEDYSLRAKIVLENLPRYDFLYIHLKGPDEPAHDGNFRLKREIIELIDLHFFGNLLPNLNLSETVIAVTADHSTPCEIKAHSADAVPLLIYGKGKDITVSFGESECEKGEIGRILGREIIGRLIS